MINKIHIKMLLYGVLLVWALLSSCAKEDRGEITLANSFTIKASLSTTSPATKTQHEFSDNSLKVRWSNGDEIAVSDGKKIFKFKQIGEITDNGHSAIFSSESTNSIGEGEIIAVYPYTTELIYDLTTQTGKIGNLFQTDMLLARANITSTIVEDLVFLPLCAVIRFPKDTTITDKNFSGEIKLTISGDNVGGKMSISKSGNIDIQKSSITIPISISKGRIAEDSYFVFVPKEKEGSFTYHLNSDRGDEYSFDIENITTTSIYIAKTICSHFVVFDDQNFKKYCVENFDLDGDGEISLIEARNVTRVNLITKRLNISSLKGIEYFKNLSFLKCNGGGGNGTGLSSLDVHQNTKLDTLWCYGNEIQELDVSCNKELTNLECDDNKIKELDVSNNIKLKTLVCGMNELTSLDLSQNLNLTKLICYKNQLTELDLSNNVELTLLNCYSNLLSSLDVSKNTALTTFSCYSNQLLSLDLSQNTALTTLSCYSNQLSTLDLSKNVALTTLSCYSNQLTSLDLGNNTELKSLNCNSNQLTSLDVSKNVALTTLSCYSNQITSLDVSKNTALTSLTCSANQLTRLDVSKNLVLASLSCYSNQITSLSVSNISSLRSLNCYSNQLSIIDVSGCSSLSNFSYYPNPVEYFNISGTALQDFNINTMAEVKEIDAVNCAKLKSLQMYGNSSLHRINISGCAELETLNLFYLYSIKDLNASNCPKLTSVIFNSNNNKWSTLNFSGCTSLVDFSLPLYSYTNEISLDLSRCTSLTSLNLIGKSLKELKVNGCVSLVSLRCSSNRLTRLDLSDCNALVSLYCRYNKIEELDVSKNKELFNLSAWSGDNNDCLKTLRIKKGQNIRYLVLLDGEVDPSSYQNYTINPSDYGTTIFEVD